MTSEYCPFNQYLKNLKPEELYDGIHVQCLSSSTIYVITMVDDRIFYGDMKDRWKQDARFVKDVWWETKATVKLNRVGRIEQILK